LQTDYQGSVLMDRPNPQTGRPIEGSINLIKVWDWIWGKKRKKFREWLANNRKRRRQNLHYKEPDELTESELYDELVD
jgi:hypothetical protein